MNCKQGDLAVVVRAKCIENVGRIVHVVSPAPRPTWKSPSSRVTYHISEGEPVWLVEAVNGQPFVTQSLTGRTKYQEDSTAPFRDQCLRPIRHGEGDDETLSWAGKPEKVAA